MGAEYELKYRADEQIQAAIAQEHSGKWTSVTMETTYYDTPSGALSAKRYMLRSRMENGTCICTLKTPGKGNERGEWEVRCDSVTDAVQKLCKLGCPEDLVILCAEGLIPICGAKFIRQITLLHLPDCSAELALDKGILFGKGKELPLCEIELELKTGSKEALDAYGAAFAAKFNLVPEVLSKFARALYLYKEV